MLIAYMRTSHADLKLHRTILEENTFREVHSSTTRIKLYQQKHKVLVVIHHPAVNVSARVTTITATNTETKCAERLL